MPSALLAKRQLLGKGALEKGCWEGVRA